MKKSWKTTITVLDRNNQPFDTSVVTTKIREGKQKHIESCIRVLAQLFTIFVEEPQIEHEIQQTDVEGVGFNFEVTGDFADDIGRKFSVDFPKSLEKAMMELLQNWADDPRVDKASLLKRPYKLMEDDG